MDWTEISNILIDEANEMKNLTKSKGGPEVLKMLLKMYQTSSDSFYQLWLSCYIGSNCFGTFVVGLSKEDAQQLEYSPYMYSPTI